MGRWRKLGCILDGIQFGDWACGYAAVPTAVHRHGDIFRIYISARDSQQRSRPAWVDFNVSSRQVVDVCSQPILPLGELGAFDDSGVMPTWILPQDDGDLMYYIGWNQGVSVPFRNAIGIAKQDSAGNWRKLYPGPILDRTRDEPHFVASCAVLQDGETFHNWYLSCTEWRLDAGKPIHRYHLKYAYGATPVDWIRQGHIAIDFIDDEYAISRPSVLRNLGGGFDMWFSARGAHYQIFKATSQDGKHWQRAQQPELTPSDIGWDSQMVCYPFVFDHADHRFMLFNGNGYGRSGLGLAIWEGSTE